MTEKPPVLSDEEMFNIREEQAYKTKDDKERLACLICGSRNACTIFRHQPVKQNGEPRGGACSASLQDADRVAAYYEPLIQQAKEEVARGIFEEIEGYEEYIEVAGVVEFFMTTKQWQALKSKHLKG